MDFGDVVRSAPILQPLAEIPDNIQKKEGRKDSNVKADVSY